MGRIKAVFNWSGGKDSAHALWRVIQSEEYEVIALLTTMNRETHRSTMHDIPLELLECQAEAIGIPLYVVDLTPKGNMEDYSEAMRRATEHFKSRGVTHFIFGDIFLHDVRQYRESQLAPLGIEVVEPLWSETSEQLIEAFLTTDLKTMVVTTMDDGLGREAIGKTIDREFIESLPEGMDPNGENGEYHTFCYAGSIFKHDVPFEVGLPYSKTFEIGMDDGSKRSYTYWFADLKSKSGKSSL